MISSACDSGVHKFGDITIDKKALRSFQKLKPASVVRMSSRGGWPEGIDIGNFIFENKISLQIEEECLSACAEYLLPASKSVNFIGSPLIAVHRNPWITHSISQIDNADIIHNCNSNTYDKYIAFINKVGISKEYNPELLRRLELIGASYKINAFGCPFPYLKFKNQQWLLNSAQIEKFFNIEFSGTVCADNPNKCKTVIDSRWKYGTRVIIGNEVYVSKGR